MMSKKAFFRSTMAFLLLFAVSTHVGAQEISVEAARQAAASFLKGHAAKLPAKSRKGMMKAPPAASQLQLVHTQEDQLHKSPALYVFEQPKQGGFVIASADERVVPIFGFFEDGTFQDAIKESCCFKAVLENFGKQITYARENGLPQFTSTLNDDNDFPPIEPITRNGASWYQGKPLNNLCPMDKNTGKRCVTGCVANTMAILMYHHQWPERGVGSHSYQWRDTTLTANFGETTYRYDLMKGDYDHYYYSGGAYYDDDPEDAVATLLYHCGVAVNMGYSSSSSGANIHRNNAMESFFRYKYVKKIWGDDYTKVSEIHDALSNNNPLCAYNSRHQFLIDGYQPGGFIHLNMHSGMVSGYVHVNGLKDGWLDGGSSDAWNYSIYEIDLFVPEKDVKTIANDEIEYEIVFNKATITKGTGTGNLVIPSTVSDEDGVAYPVTWIRFEAFKDCSGLTSVTIGNSVTTIGNYAFQNCSNLTSIEIPNSVTNIGARAFSYCSGLTSIEIPNSVTSIGNSAFYGCSGLTSITIPNSVESIGSSAFSLTGIYNNSADGVFYVDKWACGYKGTMPANTNLVIREGTLGIADYAFSGCTGLTGVTIPNSVTSIGNYAFNGCSGLTSITIPNSVTSICDDAFEGCSGLTSVTFHCKEIRSWFSGISAIKEIVIGKEVESIGYRAFRKCSGLTSVTIPNSVENIGESAFSACSGLTSITIPNSVTHIGDYAFSGCTGLTSITIPNSVTHIGTYEFSGCSGLTNVTIGNSVETIRFGAFKGCSGLTSVTIPNSVTSIGYWAFEGCSGLTSVTIPNSVTSIDFYAFSGCSGLTNVTIGNSVETILSGAFEGCSGLTSVTSYIENPFAIDSGVFTGIPSDATLYVPIGTAEKYKSTNGWKNFKNIVEIEIDGIEGVYSDENNRETKTDNRWYSVDGVKLNGEPTKKGVYIRNGKKVVK